MNTPDTGVGRISVNIDSHDDVWEITIDSIRYKDQSYSIPYESSKDGFSGIQLMVKLKTPTENYSRVRVNFLDIKDEWSEEYTYTYWDGEKEAWGKNTAIMNRIVWYDLDDNEKLSPGDIIVIEKEGGIDWQILPGDEISIVARIDGIVFFTISESSTYFELPNTTETPIHVHSYNHHSSRETTIPPGPNLSVYDGKGIRLYTEIPGKLRFFAGLYSQGTSGSAHAGAGRNLGGRGVAL